MIRRVLWLVLSCYVFAVVGKAADVPSASVYTKHSTVKIKKKPRPGVTKQAAKTRAAKPILAAAKPIQAKDQERLIVTRSIPEVDKAQEIDLSWVLDPLVANADGGKKEDSAAIQGNLVVPEPGYISAPYMQIELNGHIVKTADTTVRLDIKIDGKNHTTSWPTDDIQAGKFKITLNAEMSEGKLPAYFPVSAIAFVTNSSKRGAAMVSLEKINIRVGKVRVAATQ
jgi:hypothetical protein